MNPSCGAGNSRSTLSHTVFDFPTPTDQDSTPSSYREIVSYPVNDQCTAMYLTRDDMEDSKRGLELAGFRLAGNVGQIQCCHTLMIRSGTQQG